MLLNIYALGRRRVLIIYHCGNALDLVSVLLVIFKDLLNTVAQVKTRLLYRSEHLASLGVSPCLCWHQRKAGRRDCAELSQVKEVAFLEEVGLETGHIFSFVAVLRRFLCLRPTLAVGVAI